MKPSPTFIFTSFIIIALGFLITLTNISDRKNSSDSRHKQRMIFIDKIEDFKKEFNSDPNVVLTKSDLVTLAEMNRYQSEIDKLYLEDKIERSKDINAVFPDYILVIFILWLSFQIGALDKKIQGRSMDEK